VEWVEVRGKSVEIAVEAGLQELGLEKTEQADVEVLQEPERGFLGMGGRDAVVRLKAKPKRRRSRSRSKSASKQGETSESAKPTRSADKNRTSGSKKPKPKPTRPEKESTVSREEQAEVITQFLNGLLDSFGLEGDVQTSVDGDAVIANVVGDQTEALVGTKGVILQAVHELTRTVVQRRTHEGVRLRLDIAGYVERRREALKIYAGRLAEQVIEDGQERMLEPMNASDRKVIHDAVQEIEGVSSYSEGEEPRRSVVISPS
jgi:spoIIIJ-associated protein